jgi:hypothetical protein
MSLTPTEVAELEAFIAKLSPALQADLGKLLDLLGIILPGS